MNRRWWIAAVAVLTLAAMVAGAYMVMGMGKAGVKKKAPKIALVTPNAPPPPPPPPKFEKKPDPPKEQEVKMAQPEPKNDDPPPSPELKMEGAAGDGPSAFGSGKVSNEDLSKLGSGERGGTGTGMFDPYANYMNLAKGEVQRFLKKNTSLRRRRYALDVHLWVSASGAVSRYELAGSSGDAQTDEAVSQALALLPALSQTLPNNMPQPLRLRISTGS
jgi:protein TonB